VDPGCDVRRRRGLDPRVDLGLLQPQQHRFQIVAARLDRRTPILADRPVAGQR
jgi:hypothetical protein